MEAKELQELIQAAVLPPCDSIVTVPAITGAYASQELERRMQANPDEFFIALYSLVRDITTPADLRRACLIILQNNLQSSRFRHTAFQDLRAATVEHIKHESIEILFSYASEQYKEHIAKLISNLAVSLHQRGNQIRDILQLLAAWTQSPVETQRETSLLCFTRILVHSEDIENLFEILSDTFVAGLEDSSPVIQQMSAVACVHFASACLEFRDSFANSIPKLFEIIAHCMNTKEILVIEILELMTQLIEGSPGAIDLSEREMDILLEAATHPDYELRIRAISLEVIITYAEQKPRSSFLRSHAPFLQKLVTVLLNMMSLISDNEDWNKGEEYDIDDEEAETACSILDRLALAVHNNIMPILFENGVVQAMISSENWKERNAALTAIAIIGEGCCDSLKDNLSDVVDIILHSVKDPTARVRWTAIHSIGQLSTDFAPLFQKRFHHQILSIISNGMKDDANPRIQSVSAEATINFCNEANCELIKPYLEELMNNIMYLLSIKNEGIISGAITAAASIADSTKSDFVPYYKKCMDIIIPMIDGRGQVDSLGIRGKAIECVALTAASVGKEAFSQYQQEVMNLITTLAEAELPPADPRMQPLSKCWGNLSKVLGEDLKPYFARILPRLLEAAVRQPNLRMLAEDDPEDETGWQFLELDNQTKMGIESASVEAREAAFNMLYWVASFNAKTIQPHISQILPICMDSFNFVYNSGVRTASAAASCSILKIISETEELAAAARQIFQRLVMALLNETDNEVYVTQLEYLLECINMAVPNFFTTEEIGALKTLITTIFDSYTMEREQAEENMENEEDLEFIASSLKGVNEILEKMTEIIGKTLKFAGPLFVPTLWSLCPFYSSMRTSNLESENTIAACFFSDLVEYGGELTKPMFTPWLPFIVEMIDHPADVRQAAVYGLGVTAELHPDVFLVFKNEVLQGLHRVITMEDSREEENIFATENAICALGKIIQHHGESLDIGYEIPKWISYLPTDSKDEETDIIYKQFCHFAKLHPAHVFGENFDLLGHMLTLIAEAFQSPQVKDETKQILTQTLQDIRTNSPPAAIQSAVQFTEHHNGNETIKQMIISTISA